MKFMNLRFTNFALLLSISIATSANTFASSRNGSQTYTQAHQVVFEVSSDKPESWKAVLNNIENVRKSLGEKTTAANVVTHGKGIYFLHSKNNDLKERMKTLSDSGVTFLVCENTMKRQKIEKSDLMDFAKTVDSGVAEVVRKQEQGWSYVKSG